ncbi:MAG TPA: DUF881 domain-containing protein [Nocardioidaceae bacterium]|nr:DUF881 domain-containing protein [Nocardioidaceae bacterium]
MKLTRGWGWAVPAVAAIAGILFAASAFTADGTDLRSTTTDPATLVAERADEVADLNADKASLAKDVADLRAEVNDIGVEQALDETQRLEGPAGMDPVSGPGLVVSLDDAPQSRLDEHPGVDPNLLVVHQQDIQAFVNALWAAGAKAISLQGQRLISTTGIKCVGNTVVLEGVPYSPPYRIEAVGDINMMRASLAESQSVQIYEEYVNAYDLGLSVEDSTSLDIPAYNVTPQLEYAKPLN